MIHTFRYQFTIMYLLIYNTILFNNYIIIIIKINEKKK